MICPTEASTCMCSTVRDKSPTSLLVSIPWQILYHIRKSQYSQATASVCSIVEAVIPDRL